MKRQAKLLVGLTIGLTLLFCSSFVFFYHRAQQKLVASAASSPKGLDKPLPEAVLTDIESVRLDDQALRKGKVVLVFVTSDCAACKTEAEFLKTVVGRKDGVRFYGVISYGDKKSSLATGAEKFPFKVFFDEEMKLASALGINRVPVKIYLENGVIKKAWGGATTGEEKKSAFVNWLDEL